MPVLKAYHRYININKKSKYISEIMPMQDMEVPQKMYDDFVEEKKEKVAE